MRAGRLRERVKFQRLKDTNNAFGEEPDRKNPDNWTEIAEVWAGVEPVAGKEFFAAMQTQSEVTTRIVTRHDPRLVSVTAKDRILHGSTAYDIQHPPIDPNSKHSELQFMCTQHSSN